MYTIKAFVDGQEYPIHNPKAKVLITGEPYFETGDNVNGQAEFTVYPTHPYYSKVKKLTTDIVIYNNGVEEFAGRVLYDDEDSKGIKHVFVEGELAFFCDSIQRPKVYHNTPVRAYLQDIIDRHNAQVEERKQFQLGRVTVTDPNDSLYRYSNYETTREILKGKLTDRLGGHLVIRKENGIRFLDYLSDETFYKTCEQPIRFGKNLLDYSRNMDASDLVTCVIPLGAKLEESSIEGLEERLTIKDVNGGVDYVTDDNAVAAYGKIYATVTWDDVTVPANLKKKAEEYLQSVQFEKMVLEVKAIDLSLTDEDYEQFQVGSQVHCISEPNGLDSYFPISSKKVYLTQFSKNSFTLGSEARVKTYTSSKRQESTSIEETVDSLPSKREILEQALRDATDMMNAYSQDGVAKHFPNEFTVADHADIEQARNLWRWGLGGLAHYSEGYNGPVDGVALTMDGKINGKMLLVDSVYAESIDIGYRQSVETAISTAEESANAYTDGKVKVARETIETSITNLENRINLSVRSTKEAVAQKNYVTGGEEENLQLSDFTVSGSVARIELAEYLNMKCLKLTFTGTGTVYLNQALGALPAGKYKIAAYAAFENTNTRPTYIAYGFSDNRSTAYFSGYTAEEFHEFSKTVSITRTSKTISVGVYGTSGKVCYITNIRCLRDFQELLDDLSAEFTVGIGEVKTSVKDVYENSQHDYCLDPTFEDGWGSFWYRNNTTYIYASNFRDRNCGVINLGDLSSGATNYYIRSQNPITVPKTGPFTIRFKALSNNSQARLRCTFNTTKYTNAGDIGTNWTTVELTFDSVTAGSRYLYFYGYTTGCYICITDVEILGYASAYSEGQLTVLQDSITAEVTRAKSSEDTLKASIKVNADNITSCVTKGNVGSYITQYYNNVIVAFNNSSRYVQLGAGAVEIYDASITDQKRRARFDQNGNHFYRDGYYVGKIGTNSLQNDSSKKGLTFDLEYQGAYMTWSAKASQNANVYTMKWSYVQSGKNWGNYDADRLHAGCDIDMHYWKIRNVSWPDGAINGTINFVQVLDVNSDGRLASWSRNCSLTFKNGILISGTWYH